MNRDRRLGLAALASATLLWGFTFTLVGDVVGGRGITEALVFLAVRFTIATLAFAPFARQLVRATVGRGRAPWIDAGLVGLLTFAGFAFQTLGLLSTTPPRSAFVTSLTVVFVPFVAAFFHRREFSWAHLGYSLLALGGVGLVVAPGGTLAPNRGDLLTLGCSITFALQIVVIERATRRTSPLVLTAGQIASTALIAWAALFAWEGAVPRAWPGMYATAAVTGVVCTSACLMLVAWGQVRVASETAAVVFSLEPIFAAIFDGLWTGVWLDLWQWGGGLLVVLAAVLAARLETRRAFELTETKPA